MKKFIICAAVALAAGFMVSCDKEEKAQCWEITEFQPGYGYDVYYYWGTESDLKAGEQEAADRGIEYTYRAADYSESDCR